MTWEGLSPPYRTIVVDPPWEYRVTKPTIRTGHKHPSADDHYSTLTNREIAALPVAELADTNAHLYLWVTNPRLFGNRAVGGIGPDEILHAWGFRYITTLTWLKQGTLGMGFYFRGETEHVLFGVRGDAPIPVDRRERN